MIGRVVSIKMSKSAVVLISGKKTHPLYKKMFTQTKRYLVDDQIGVHDGDIVEIIKVRPISKLKHFKINKVIGTDVVALGTAILKEKAEEAIAQVLPEEEKESEESKTAKIQEEVIDNKKKIEIKKTKIKKEAKVKQLNSKIKNKEGIK